MTQIKMLEPLEEGIVKVTLENDETFVTKSMDILEEIIIRQQQAQNMILDANKLLDDAEKLVEFLVKEE
jgi:hypothetical protein